MTAGHPSDPELMISLASGDMAALGELVRRHQERAVGLAYRTLHRWDLAEEVAQEAFLRVFRAARHYQPEAKFTTWLYRIVVNLCLDSKRRLKREPGPLPDAARIKARIADPIDREERARRVQEAVARLPERQRMAVVLHRYQGLSHQEIAESTGWSSSAVESLLVRAYAALRELLADLEEK